MLKKYYFLNAEAKLELKNDSAQLLKAACPEVQAALVSASIRDAIPGREASHSGVLELWFREAADTSSFDATSLFGNSVVVKHQLEGFERTVMRTPEFYSSPSIKGLYAFRRKQDMPVEEFQQYWWHNHGPIASLTEGATCYVQTHITLESYGQGNPPFDGVTELYWPNLNVALAALGSRQMTEDQGDDAKNFVDLSSVDLAMTEQHMIIPPWKETA